MILKRLVEFDQRQRGTAGESGGHPLPQGYQPVLVNRIVRLSVDGRLRDVITLAGDKRGMREGKVMPVPVATPPRSSNAKHKAHLIVDKAIYVFGVPKSEDPKDVRNAAEYHKTYVDLVAECAKATRIPEVAILSSWLESRGSGYDEAVNRMQAHDEIISFQVGDSILTELPAVQEFWSRFAVPTGKLQRCLVTGRMAAVQSRMPFMLNGIPDGKRPMRRALVCVNKPAFGSYGLKAALNSPISREAGEAFANAINSMVRSDKHRLRLGPKTIYLFWTRGEVSFDPLSFLQQPDPAEVRELLRSAEVGRERRAATEDDFYVLCLSGNGARAGMRDYLETTIPAVRESLRRWFALQQIEGWNTGEPKQFGVYALCASLYLRPQDDMAPGPPAALLRAALTGVPLPLALLGQAVKRNVATQGPFTKMGAGRKALSLSRLALIKAIYLSNRPKEEENALQTLDPQMTDPGYVCGRLLAVVESIQRAAAPGIKATLTDRYYGSASSAPASVFGNLMRMAQPHLAKLRKTNEPAFLALQRRLEEILVGLPEGFPATLTLQQQALFSLGYYHQKAKDRGEARARKELKELAEDIETEKEGD
jgi:CRISPR-associated protein Csd1